MLGRIGSSPNSQGAREWRKRGRDSPSQQQEHGLIGFLPYSVPARDTTCLTGMHLLGDMEVLQASRDRKSNFGAYRKSTVTLGAGDTSEGMVRLRKGSLHQHLRGGLQQHPQTLASFSYSAHTLWGEDKERYFHGMEALVSPCCFPKTPGIWVPRGKKKCQLK